MFENANPVIAHWAPART